MLHTRILKLDDSLDSYIWSKWFRLLELERQNKIKNLRFFDDRLRSLTAGILLRSMLFKHCQLTPTDLVFSTSKKGKPFLASHPEIFFNLSHSGNYICCSISSSPVGIDVEKMETIDIEGIASYFSVHEQKYICSRDTKREKLDAFYSVWTLKEAFCKYIGSGLSMPLDSYTFFLTGKTISLSTQIENNAQFYSHTIDEQYKLALCSPILSENSEKQLTLTEFIKNSPF